MNGEDLGSPQNERASEPDGRQRARNVLSEWLAGARPGDVFSIRTGMQAARVGSERMKAVLDEAVGHKRLARDPAGKYYVPGKRPLTAFERAMQLAEQLVEMATDGRLPTVRDAARSWGIHVTTVNRAYDELGRRGRIVNRGRGRAGGWHKVGPTGPGSRFARAEATGRRLRSLLAPHTQDPGSHVRARPVVATNGAPIPASADAQYPALVTAGAPLGGLIPFRFAQPIPFVMLSDERGPLGLIYLGGWVVSADALAVWMGEELGLDRRPIAREWTIELPREIPNATVRVPLAVLKLSFWQHTPAVLTWADGLDGADQTSDEPSSPPTSSD